MVFTDNNPPVSSSSSSYGGATSHQPDDDISLILRHLLHRSSSSSLTPPPPPPPSSFSFPPPPPPPPPPFFADNHSAAVFSNPAYFPVRCGSSDEYDCESEDAAERTAETNHAPPKNHSKRSRAAEVHNLSEKRRRSRINEKMKALQNLIPNSNKTDKASMLDEAIEYLKQLQLQVQMLSIRNGLSLHPMCLPGVPGIVHPSQISQMGVDIRDQRGGSLDANARKNLDHMTSNTSDTMFHLPKQCALPETGRPALNNVSTVNDPETVAFGLETCLMPSYGSFEIRNQNLKAVLGEQSLHQDHFMAKNTDTKILVNGTPLLPETQEFNLKEYNHTAGLTKQRYGPQDIILGNVGVNEELS